jgi:hypothetical protein
VITITLTDEEAYSYINHVKIVKNLENEIEELKKDTINLENCINNLKQANSSYNKEMIVSIGPTLKSKADNDVEIAKSLENYTSTERKFSKKTNKPDNFTTSQKINKWEEGEIKALFYILNKSTKSVKHISYLKRKLNKNRTSNSIRSKLYRLGHSVDKEGYIVCTNQEKYKSELSKLNIK